MTFARNAWYCAGFSAEIGSAGLARRILNEPILIVRDQSGSVHAIGDVCPHRFAPLHLGRRIEDMIECPYHGLRFDFAGQCVFDPHGAGKSAGRARVPAYPVAEKEGVIWVWPGDPSLADGDQLPDLGLIEQDGAPPLTGCLTMAVDYRLVLDNLLDLSHAAYLHAGSLSPPQARRETSHDADDRSVRVRTIMRDVPTPSSQALYYEEPRGDYHSNIEWIFPGTLRQQLAMTATGSPPEAGAITRNAHLVTPATASSTHYFWMHTRNRATGDEGIDARLRQILTNAFLTEDEPMIRACQENMAGREFFSMAPVFLETDYAGTRCRRMIEKAVALEAGPQPGSAARDASGKSADSISAASGLRDPRLPSLTRNDETAKGAMA